MPQVFLWRMLKRLHHWLNCADSASRADLIFVLAGSQCRKSYGLELQRQKLAPQVLLSTSRFEVRRLATLDLPRKFDLLKMVKNVAPQQRHFFVSVTRQEIQAQRISRGKFGTLSEIYALAEWLRERPQITSLSILSSGNHLRRLRICCRAILSENMRVQFLRVPESSFFVNGENWWLDKQARRMLLGELFKIACYSVLLRVDTIVPRSRAELLEIVHPSVRVQ